MFFLTMLEYFPQRPFFRSGSSPGATASVVTLRNELMNPTFCVYMLGLLRESQTQASEASALSLSPKGRGLLSSKYIINCIWLVPPTDLLSLQ